jgi:radical SAM superfamily enzyme YgiQ (UPF0313 family)
MNWPGRKRSSKSVLLVFPREPGAVVSNDAVFPFPLQGLTQIAAAFPPGYRLRLVDETVSPLRGTEEADLVCISSLTSTARRAYALADAFRSRGIPVVLGGVHASVMPDDARPHASSLVIGEAEGVMADLIADFERGELLPEYRGTPPDLDAIPSPAARFLNWRHRLFLSAVQTSRGCPNSCDFCSVPTISGRRLRLKSLRTLERELETAGRRGSRRLFVVDDNFTADRDRALAIMDLFRRRRFRWMGFSNLSVADDTSFLKALRDSGCVSLFIGFESLSSRDLYRKNRRFADVRAMEEAVRRIHAFDIGIQGSFIFGFDSEGPETFRETVKFIQDNGIELPNVNILTPFPGTPLAGRLEREGRILHRQWHLYDMSHVVFEPRPMSAAELQQGYAWTLKYLSSPTSIFARLRNNNKRHYRYFLTANFALHRSHTRLAHRLWDSSAQSTLTEMGLCRF